MARPLRIEYPGAYYHVIQRGMERRDIFAQDNDKERFLLYLTLAYKGYKAIIHTYCLMKNHYHLILETPKGNLSKIMHYIGTSYAAYFNSKYRRVGPLYQGRYKSILVQQDEYLDTLSKYIHLNPVRVKLVKDPKDYKWSSYQYFISNKSMPEFLKISFILLMFNKEMVKAKRLYKEFALEGIAKEEKEIKNNIKKGFILGNDDFFNEIKEKFIDGRNDCEIPILKEIRTKDDKEIEDYIRDTVEEEICENIKMKRNAMIYLTRRYTQKTLKDIASVHGGIGYTGISELCRRIENQRKKDKELNRTLKKIETRVMCHMKT